MLNRRLIYFFKCQPRNFLICSVIPQSPNASFPSDCTVNGVSNISIGMKKLKQKSVGCLPRESNLLPDSLIQDFNLPAIPMKLGNASLAHASGSFYFPKQKVDTPIYLFFLNWRNYRKSNWLEAIHYGCASAHKENKDEHFPQSLGVKY